MPGLSYLVMNKIFQISEFYTKLYYTAASADVMAGLV